MFNKNRISRRWLLSAMALTPAAMALASCGGEGGAEGGTAGEAVSDQDVQAALEAGGSLLIWGWDAALPPVVEAFKDAYPNVQVELANVGTAGTQYSALQNAIAAGTGIPDVVHLEYSAIPQFAMGASLEDLSSYGADGFQDAYTPGTWSSVTVGGSGVFGLPMDSGPMAMFYNADRFAELGIDVPETWDEFIEAARQVRAKDPRAYLLADNGDAGYTMSGIWQAGGRPFQADGTDVTVNLADEGSQRFTSMWQAVLEEGLAAPMTTWSNEWYQGLNSGSILTIVLGAWMPSIMENDLAEMSGAWRAARMPQWDAASPVTAENGGSGLSVMSSSSNKLLAYGFVQFSNHGEGVQTRLDAGTFPATKADLEADVFLSKEWEYFGGQKVNEVLSESASLVADGWQYLPFQTYATTIFNDHVGQAYGGQGTLQEGLNSWQDAIISYGNEQGFSMHEG